MSKDFLSLTSKEKDAEARKWEKGISFEETRPMSRRSKALWKMAKRGRGRPRKPSNEKAKRVLISLDPKILALAEAFASSNGLDRSKLFAVSVQAFIASEKAIENAMSGNAGRGERRSRDRRRSSTHSASMLHS